MLHAFPQCPQEIYREDCHDTGHRRVERNHGPKPAGAVLPGKDHRATRVTTFPLLSPTAIVKTESNSIMSTRTINTHLKSQPICFVAGLAVVICLTILASRAERYFAGGQPDFAESHIGEIALGLKAALIRKRAYAFSIESIRKLRILCSQLFHGQAHNHCHFTPAREGTVENRKVDARKFFTAELCQGGRFVAAQWRGWNWDFICHDIATCRL